MTNRFYTPSGNPADFAKANSPVLRAEFRLIDSAMLAVQNEIDLKAPMLSPSLSGAPTAPTAAAGTDTAQLATTAFVQHQVGPTIESPALTGMPTAPTAQVGDVGSRLATLDYVNAMSQSAFAMKGPWVALTGPINTPATVIHAGQTWILLRNLADVTASEPGVGADWFGVPLPAESAYICNHDQAVIPVPVAGAFMAITAVVAVDATRELLIISGTTSAWAVCYNNTTKQYGTPVLIRTTTANSYPMAVLAAPDRVLVVSCVTTAFEAVVLSLSGTSITVGVAATSTLPESCSTYDPPIAVGSSFVLVLRGTVSPRAIAITVADSTPSIGSPVAVYYGSGVPILRANGASSVVVFGTYSTTIFAIPVAVSGVSLTPGTVATTAASQITTVVPLSTGRFAVIYMNTATMGAIVSVSGTVATMTTVALGTGAGISAAGVKIGDQLVVASEAGKVNVLTDVSGTATAGAAVVANVGAVNACGYGPDYAVFATPGATSTIYSVVKINGNNPVLHDTGSVSLGYCTDSGGMGHNGIPLYVLSTGGKSGNVAPSSSGGTGVVLQFGSSVKVKLPPPLMQGIYFVKKSDSVAFASYPPSATSTTIRIHRLEMV